MLEINLYVARNFGANAGANAGRPMSDKTYNGLVNAVIKAMSFFSGGGASISKVMGVWEGKNEETTIVTIWIGETMSDYAMRNVRKLADEIKRYSNQDSVAITARNLDVHFV